MTHRKLKGSTMIDDSSVEVFEIRNGRGTRLMATLHRPRGACGVGVVVCHGMLSSRSSLKHIGLCEAFASRGMAALRFDFSGRGESEGDPSMITYEGQLDDLRAVVTEVFADVERIGLVGSSMGGAVAILGAREIDRVAAVAGIAAVGRPMAVLSKLLGDPSRADFWKERGSFTIEGSVLDVALLRSSEVTDVVSAARALTVPLLLIHGVEDQIVDIEQARELAAVARRGTLFVVNGGDHLLRREEDQRILKRKIGDFLVQHLLSADRAR